jgi:hypothetical protein
MDRCSIADFKIYSKPSLSRLAENTRTRSRIKLAMVRVPHLFRVHRWIYQKIRRVGLEQSQPTSM